MICEPSEELRKLSKELLETILYEDMIDDFNNGGMFREKAKAKNYKST